MAISYKKLWKLLIDKDMRKEDLRLKAERNGAFAAKPLCESPHNSSLVGIFGVLFLLYIPSVFSLRFVSDGVSLRRPFLLPLKPFFSPFRV